MKKAQIEMMGLVVVVILITVGLFFYLAFAINNENTANVVDVYSSEEMANNFLIALQETYVPECSSSLEEVTMKDLAIDCARYNRTGTGNYECTGLNSCEKFYNLTEIILNDSLQPYGYNYNFSYIIRVGSQSHKVINLSSETGCKKGRAAPGIQQVPLFRTVSGTAYFQFYVCV